MTAYAAPMLLVIGDAREDTVVDLTASPTRGGVGSARIVRRRGGSAANIAAYAASAGYPVRFAGQVGADHSGDFVIADLQHHGVDVRASRQGRTAAAVIVRSGSTTTRLIDRATATQCTTLHPEILDDVSVVHLPASTFSAEPFATAAEDVLGEAIERGLAISMDVGGVGIIDEFGRNEFVALVHHISPRVFFCNRVESERLGLRGRDPMPGADLTVITAGVRPTVLVDAMGEVSSFPVDDIDGPTDREGVGDAFIAGYLVAQLAGQPPTMCVQAAQLLASAMLRQAKTGRGRLSPKSTAEA
jgi:sugar/nucleoside kinase (ribokinase family)